MRVMRTLAASALLVMLVCGCHRETANPEKPSGGEASGKGDAKSQKSGSDSKSNGSDASSAQSGTEKDGSVPTDTVRIEQGNQARAGIRVAPVTVRRMPRMLAVAGQVAMDERHTDHIGAIADGRVDQVYVLPGDFVHRHQTLATLHSHSVHETAAALSQAFSAVARQKSAVSFALQERDRYTKLYAIQAASLEEKQRAEQGVAQANQDLAIAEANVRAEREHLSELLQVDPESLRPETLYRQELIPIRAVADGFVVTRSVTPGQVVNTGDEAFVTTNLATVWVNAAVNEKDLPEVHRGARALVLLQGQSSGQTGEVAMLGDVVDPQTRTLPVRVAVANPGTHLRPGMFVTASITEPATRDAIFVPGNALQDINGFRVVFVTADGTNFQARTVKTGLQTEGMVEVLEGLQPLDHVVVDGAFMVKGELLKGTVGEG